jgi:hypothetical protein
MKLPPELDRALTNLRDELVKLPQPDSSASGMQIAACLIEDAALLLARTTKGAAIVEMLLLSSRAEAIAQRCREDQADGDSGATRTGY